MPIFDYECKCGQTKIDEFVNSVNEIIFCPECNEGMIRQFPNRLGPVNFGWPDGGVTLEHIGPKPVTFETRGQAQKYAKENNVQLGCLG